eukprot:UN4072
MTLAVKHWTCKQHSSATNAPSSHLAGKAATGPQETGPCQKCQSLRWEFMSIFTHECSIIESQLTPASGCHTSRKIVQIRV